MAYSGAACAGIIVTRDGIRYVFELRNCEPERGPPAAGDFVLFEPSGDGYAVRVKTVRSGAG